MNNVIKVEYSDELFCAAQQFLINMFADRAWTKDVHPVTVEAAMNIVAGHSYYQPNNPTDQPQQ